MLYVTWEVEGGMGGTKVGKRQARLIITIFCFHCSAMMAMDLLGCKMASDTFPDSYQLHISNMHRIDMGIAL